MRLKIEFVKDGFIMPLDYQYSIQGFIYQTMKHKEIGKKYHNEGFKYDNKHFKLFVYSNLLGKYQVKDNQMHFERYFRVLISSADPTFLQNLYDYLLTCNELLLKDQVVKINKLDCIDIPYFKGRRTVVLKTLSPIVVYKTYDGFTHYYKPSDVEFETLVLQNLKAKLSLQGLSIDLLDFKIESVLFEKERIVKFKNTYHRAYLSSLRIQTNYETLICLYNTGIGSKGSSGFGMIDVNYEENFISI